MRALICTVLGVAGCLPGPTWAQKPVTPTDFQATVWASSCMACHGTDGHAEGTGLTIGGRPAGALYQLMLEFKNGQRHATVMHQHAKGYSNDELKRISEYFSKLK